MGVVHYCKLEPCEYRHRPKKCMKNLLLILAIFMFTLKEDLPSADVTLAAPELATETYGLANTMSSNNANTVIQLPAVVTVKTGRSLPNNFNVAQGAGFSCQLVPFFPSALTAWTLHMAAKASSSVMPAVQWPLGEGAVNYVGSEYSAPRQAANDAIFGTYQLSYFDSGIELC